jgi:MFS family permease
VLRATLWGVAASVALLVVAHNTAPIRLAAGLAGLCIGPLYPLLLSFLLERSPHGWIFAVAGMGSALFPWLTGLLSAHYGSLRYGLIAPCGAALLMIVLLSVSLRPAASSVLSSPSHL